MGQRIGYVSPMWRLVRLIRRKEEYVYSSEAEGFSSFT